MRLVWVPRHELNDRNHYILKKAFGKYEIRQYPHRVKCIHDLIYFAELVNADAFLVVLPDHQLAELFKYSKLPIYRFIVRRVEKDDGSKEFIIKGLEEIIDYTIVTRRIV